MLPALAKMKTSLSGNFQDAHLSSDQIDVGRGSDSRNLIWLPLCRSSHRNFQRHVPALGNFKARSATGGPGKVLFNDTIVGAAAIVGVSQAAMKYSY